MLSMLYKLKGGLILLLVCLIFLAFGANNVNATDYMQIEVDNTYWWTKKAILGRLNNFDVKVHKLGNASEIIMGATVTFSLLSGQTVKGTTLYNGHVDIEDIIPQVGDKFVFIKVTKELDYYEYNRKLKVCDGHLDVVIGDHPYDDYLIPSYDINGSGGPRDPYEPEWWHSPNIVAGSDPMHFSEKNSLTVSHELIFYPQPSDDFVDWRVDFKWAHPGIGLRRTDWKLIDWVSYGHGSYYRSFPSLPITIEWKPSDIYVATGWPDDGLGYNHFCFFVEVSAPLDPASEMRNPINDNNLAQHNFEHCFWDPGACESDKSSPAPPFRNETCYEVKYNFFVINPNTINSADVILHVELQDWPPDMKFDLEPYILPDPDFIEIDNFTYNFQNMAPDQSKVATLTLSSSLCDDVGTINIIGTIDDDPIGAIGVQTIPSECPIIQIEKNHDVLQGHFVDVSITARGGIYEMGGFDFLIAYDASALTHVETVRGQMLEDCGWEFFTYNHGAQGNCGNGCPSGMVRIVAMAETNNGPNHPLCYGPSDCDEYELAKMRFLVTNDRTFESQYIPIYFYWDECGDNTLSSVDGETLYIERRVHDHEYNLIWHEGDDIQFPEDNRIPHVGAPDICLNTDPTKPPVMRCPVFQNGGIDIIDSDSIDTRGDINLNGAANEIADAVVFTNYFIYGLAAFTINQEGQIAATDVNGDGVVLSVADLTYLIRIIVGDALPYAKIAPVTARYDIEDGILSVDHEMGAAYAVIKGNANPVNLTGNMEMKHNYDSENDVTRVLLYSMEKDHKFYGEFLELNGRLIEIEIATYEGATVKLKTDLLPKEFVLHQNKPNPFNPITDLSFSLPVASDVILEIYNITGQKVATVAEDRFEAGTHTIRWDASNFASGVYLYRITAGDFTDSRKMLLLK